MAGAKKKAKASSAESERVIRRPTHPQAATSPAQIEVQGRGGWRKKRGPAARGLQIPKWTRSIKILASVILIYHVSAMFIAPWAVPPTSSLAISARPWVAHYQTLLYLNHGYRFFAPNPGPASVVIYRLEFPDGHRDEGLFPDRNAINRDYPRLLYHRWFMLSESIGRFLGDQVSEAEFKRFQEEEKTREAQLRTAGQISEADQLSLEIIENRRLWNEAVAIRQELLAPLAKNILQSHQASAIKLYLNRRIIPSPDQIRRGAKTNDPQFLPESSEILLGKWNLEDFENSNKDLDGSLSPSVDPESLPLPMSYLEVGQ